MAKLIFQGDMLWAATAGLGGHILYLMQWLHGLERLGHRVFFLEFVNETPTAEALENYARAIAEWWHPDQTALILEKSESSLYGLGCQTVRRIAKEAAALILTSVPGRRKTPELVENVRPRVLVDQDPGFSHIWAKDCDPREIFGEQDLFFTVGGNIGSPGCRVPSHGLPWRPIWNPVIMNWWLPRKEIVRDHFTTIARWWDLGYLEFDGRMMGPKADEFRKFVDLPRLSGEFLEVVADVEPEHPDFTFFQKHGWKFTTPKIVSTGTHYRDYVNGSLGEFSCAKGIYVATKGGWFGDRSSCFLAAGRPVILQGTGFASVLPTGNGLFSVNTVEEAAEAMKAIRKDFPLHSATAREIALEYFDSDKIIGRMLGEAAIKSAVAHG